MKIVDLIQGTPEWHAHRAAHRNASDAPAMLGCSPYKSRSQLVREIATGIGGDVDAATQQRFDAGHRAEALARPLAEQIVGQELFPCVGSDDWLSASFDGLTMAGDVVWEHKSLNDELRAAMVSGCTGADLPKAYRVQVEQQLMVSGAERALFMASKWAADGGLLEMRDCWCTPDVDLRAVILAGWKQFEDDVAAYKPEAAPAPAAVGAAPDALPALSVVASGMVEHSNLEDFRAKAMAAISAVNRDLQTDDDFATAELTIKAFKAGEEKLDATKAQVLGQMADVDAVMRTIDEVSGEMRRVRLDLDKLVKAEKENRKAEIVRAGMDAVRAHYDAANATLGEHRMQPQQTLQLDIAAAIKGKKSIASMREAVDGAVANLKVAASQQADRVRANAAILAEHPDHAGLFADRVQLCATKAPDDLRNLVAARIAEARQREEDRLERERERIRQEEATRLQREQDEQQGRERAQQAAEARAAAPVPMGDSTVIRRPLGTASTAAAPGAPSTARMKLGDVNAWIAPLSISADGLAGLGFKPVASQGAAKLYAAADLPRICDALLEVIRNAPLRATEASAA